MEHEHKFTKKSCVPVDEISPVFPQECDEDFDEFILMCILRMFVSDQVPRLNKL